MVVALRAPVTPPIAYPETMYSEGTLEVPWPEQMFLTRMSNHAAQTRWVVTNLPMYTLRLGLNSPPDLAFISEKRFITGEVTEEQIIAAVEQYQPEQVLIGRRAFPRLSAYLKTDYRVLDVRGKRVLYLRKDLRGK